MQQPYKELPDTAQRPNTVLQLTVRNHSGTLSHVAGLFSRRAFNLEAVLVLPETNNDTSRMWLKVAESERLSQVLSQLQKLEDVLKVEVDADGDEVFERANAVIA